MSRKEKRILKTKVSRTFGDVLAEELKKYNRVKVTGLGVFELRKIRSRELYTPLYDKVMKSTSKQKVIFKPSSVFYGKCSKKRS